MKHLRPGRFRSGARIMPGLSLRHGIPANADVLTCEGTWPAGKLTAGMRIVSRDRGLVPLTHLTRHEPLNRLAVVHVRADAFGVGQPGRDLSLLPDQPIILRDWRALMLYGKPQARVAASRLVDGHVVTHGTLETPDMVSLHFSMPSVIYANGLEILGAGLPGLNPL